MTTTPKDLGWMHSPSLRPEEWTEQSKCAQRPKHQRDWWYPTIKDSWWKLEAARRVCAQCPVRALCEQKAWANGETHGVWGGVNFGNRDERRRRKNALAQQGAA